MANQEISKNSFLNFSSLLEFNGKVFWDNADLPEIPFAEDDEYIQLTDLQAHRIDLVAFEKYGDSELMWAILHANNVDLPNQLFEGQIIRIPAKTSIDKLIDEAQAQV